MSVPVEYATTKEMMQNMADLKELCDVILVSGIDKQKFPAHRLILMASSKYFAALLGPHFREGTEKEVILEKIDGPMLKTVLNYIYTAHIQITADNVDDIIAAASSMELIALEKRCGEFWETSLSIENCVEIFLNADQYNLKELWSKVLKFICDNFEAVAIDGIQQIDGKNFQEVLKNDQITAAETVVFDRLVHWIKINGTNAVDMLKSIRLEHIPIAFLSGTVEPFFDSYECGKLVTSEYRKRLLNPKSLCSHRYVPKAIYCSFSNPQLTGIDIQKYDIGENNWSEFKNISFGASTIKYEFGSIFVNGELYIIGGRNTSNTYYQSVESFNVDDLTRTSLPNMTTVRGQFTPISIGIYIYVFGGRNSTYLDACERFDTVNRVWQPRQKIPNALYAYSIEEFNGQIYIFGGYTSNGGFSSILYCYYPGTNSWTEKSRISYAYNSTVALAKTSQFLYVIGSSVPIVHQYEPARDVWTNLGSFGNIVAVSRSLNYCDQLYAVCSGGKFGNLKLKKKSCTFTPLQLTPSLSTSVLSSSVHLFLK